MQQYIISIIIYFENDNFLLAKQGLDICPTQVPDWVLVLIKEQNFPRMLLPIPIKQKLQNLEPDYFTSDLNSQRIVFN